MNKIITIGREFGSGGRELGKRLFDKLGFEWIYYDQEIIRKIADRTELSEEYVRHISEQRPDYAFPIHTALSFSFLDNPIWTQNQKVFKEQCDIIHEAAERSNCIIVGRCADYILKDLNPFRLFVYADMPSKIARCRAKNHDFDNLSDRELSKKIKEIDRNRSRYYEFFTCQEWGDRNSYDMCLNTSSRSVKEWAETIARMYR